MVERRNRTVVAMIRSFLKDKELPSILWGEAARHSIYILNRLSTRALSGVTPYEAWTGTKPDLGHVRVFGCITHMKEPSVHLKKLDDRSRVTIYLGREPGTKVCRLYDPKTGKINVSRDVVFEENKSWDWKKQQSEKTEINSQGSFTVHDVRMNEESVTHGSITSHEQ